MSRHTYKNHRSTWVESCIAFILSLTFLLKIRRVLMRFLPFLKLQSQVKNIVYLSWLVDIEHVRSRYPEQVQLWEKQGKTIFTILTYQHAHFGFSFLGKLRKLMPSPQQSNWRFYIDPKQQEKTAIFEQVAVDQLLYVLSGRLASDAMPAQFATVFQHQQHAEQVHTQISIDARYRLSSSIRLNDEQQLPAAWQTFFGSWDKAIRYLVDQEHAWVEWVDQPSKMSQGDIIMPFDFSKIQSAQALAVDCPLLEEWGVNPQDAFAFVVPTLDFYVMNENPVA
ncbi:DUF2071 domain-containing protein [Acinetobacter sp. Marseille-Q1618]|uniref:DUF2071 domain-containing protein n=1 Tax=Acinetobacter sp. Marseille-Q1618 TaxID=2697502 RepID=UPI00156E65A1|nr:DUF2071 domain-containing protein [Acinetobacter sp. Marseille-Q1618]